MLLPAHRWAEDGVGAGRAGRAGGEQPHNANLLANRFETATKAAASGGSES